LVGKRDTEALMQYHQIDTSPIQRMPWQFEGNPAP